MKKTKRGTLVARVSVRDIPEVLAEMRLELATLLRHRAESGWTAGEQNIIDMSVRRALNEVADVFEAGVTNPEGLADAGGHAQD